MMRTGISLSILVALLFLVSPGAGQGQGKVPLTAHKGTWKLVSVELPDEKIAFANSQPRWKIEGEKVFYGGEELGRIQIDPSTIPGSLDLTFQSSKQMLEGIYALEKDTLQVCLNRQTDGIKERPQKFSATNKAEFRVLTFQRDRNPPANAREGLPAFVGVALMTVPTKSEFQVTALIAKSPAKKAGLREKDIILKINNMVHKDLPSAVDSIRRAKPGDTISFLVRRGGQERSIDVQAGFLPFRWIAQLDG